MPIGDSTSLLFRIKGDASDAIRALNQTQREAKDLTGATSGLRAGLGALAGPATIVAAGIAAIGGAALGAGVALFGLAKRASEYGSEIYNASVKTGLTTETISALKLASDRTGVSMESLGTIVNRFSKVVGEAAQGSEKAQEVLTRLGITPQEAINDLDGALGKVFQRIQDLPDPISKATLAQQAFGKAGTELLKVIDDFNGDLPKAIEHARKLGLVMSKEDAAAADEFGDQMDTLNRQLQGVGFTIGKSLMPVFNRMAREVSDWLARNKGQVEAWASSFASSIGSVENALKGLAVEIETNQQSSLESWSTWALRLANILTTGPLALAIKNLKQSFEELERKGVASAPKLGSLADIRRLDDTDALPAPSSNALADLSTPKAVKDQLPKFDFTAEMRDYQKALRSLSPGLRDQILQYAERYGIPTSLAFAQLFSESGFRTGVSSSQGAHGIGQLQPKTASNALGRKVSKADLFDVDTNLAAWGAEMSRLFKKYGDWALASLAYHGGDGTANAFLKAQTGGEAALARFARGNPKTAKYAQKIPELSGLSAAELIGTVDFEKQLKEQETKDKDAAKFAIDLERETMDERLAIFESGQKKKAALAEEFATKLGLTEREIVEFQEQLEAEALEERKRLLEEYIAVLKIAGPEGVEELRKATLKLKLLEDEIEINRSKNAVKNEERNEKERERHKELLKEIEEIVEAEAEAFRLEEERENARDEREAERERRRLEQEEETLQRVTRANNPLGSGFGDLLDDATGNIRDFGDVMTQLGEVAAGVFMQMGQGLGNMLQQWVLLGDQSGVSMKKMVAATLAGVAAQAATLSIFHLAMGIAALTPWGLIMYGNPVNHFLASAMWGGIAAASAIAGRALAGTSFQQQTSAATGRTSSSGISGGTSARDTAAQGTAYSSYGDKPYIQEEGRNAPLGVAVQIEFKDKPAWFTQMFIAEWRANGRIRRLVEDGR